MIGSKNHENWIDEQLSRSAIKLASRLDRGGKVHHDEMERLKLLTRLYLTKKS